MARTKQVTPMRRETSSEYFSKQQMPASKRSSSMEKQSNGSAANSQESSALEEAYEKAEAGLPQLVVAVAGIYGSLYVEMIL